MRGRKDSVASGLTSHRPPGAQDASCQRQGVGVEDSGDHRGRVLLELERAHDDIAP